MLIFRGALMAIETLTGLVRLLFAWALLLAD